MKKEFICVKPRSSVAEDRFINSMDRLNSCRVVNRRDGKVFLDVNDSPCISTKDKTGSYSMSIFNSDSKQGDY